MARMGTAAASFVLALYASLTSAAHFDVNVGKGGLVFDPPSFAAAIGDTVTYHFYAKNHSVTQSSFQDPCHVLPGGIFSGFTPNSDPSNASPTTFTITVKDSKPLWFYCGQTNGNHCQSGMVHAINAPITGNTFTAFKYKASNATQSTSPPDGLPVGGVRKLSIQVGVDGQKIFSPSNVTELPGTVVEFSFNPANHSVVQSSFGDPCHPLNTGGFSSPFVPTSQTPSGVTFSIDVTDNKPIWFYCAQTKGDHCQSGMVGSINAQLTGDKTFQAFKDLAAKANQSTIPPDTPLGGTLSVNGTIIKDVGGDVLNTNPTDGSSTTTVVDTSTTTVINTFTTTVLTTVTTTTVIGGATTTIAYETTTTVVDATTITTVQTATNVATATAVNTDVRTITIAPPPGGTYSPVIVGMAGGNVPSNYNYSATISDQAVVVLDVLLFIDNFVVAVLFDGYNKLSKGSWSNVYPKNVVNALGSTAAQAEIQRGTYADMLNHYSKPPVAACGYNLNTGTVDDFIDTALLGLLASLDAMIDAVSVVAVTDPWLVPAIASAIGTKARMIAFLNLVQGHIGTLAPRENLLPYPLAYSYISSKYVNGGCTPNDSWGKVLPPLNVAKAVKQSGNGQTVSITVAIPAGTSGTLYVAWMGAWGDLIFTAVSADGTVAVPSSLSGHVWAVITTSNTVDYHGLAGVAVTSPEVVWVNEQWAA